MKTVLERLECIEQRLDNIENRLADGEFKYTKKPRTIDSRIHNLELLIGVE